MIHSRSVARTCGTIVIGAVLLALSASCGASDASSGQAPPGQPSTDTPGAMTPDTLPLGTPKADSAAPTASPTPAPTFVSSTQPPETPAATMPPDATIPTALPGLTPAVPLAEGIVGSSWILLSYGPAGDQLPALPNVPVVLNFRAMDSLGGVTGCNEYYATYTLAGSTFAVAAVTAYVGVTQSKRACVEEGAQQQEAAFIAALESATALNGQGNTLTVSYDGGELRLAPAPPPAPSVLTGTHWQLVAFETGVTATPVLTQGLVTAEFVTGEVYGTSGCNLYEAWTIVNEQKLTVYHSTQTAAACADQAPMQQEAAFLAALRSARSFHIEGDTLMLTYDGGALRFVRMQPPPGPSPRLQAPPPELYGKDPRAPTETPDPHPSTATPVPTSASP